MKKHIKSFLTITLCATICLGSLSILPASVFQYSITAEAHSDRTDSHRDNENKSGLGSDYYICNGYPLPLHDTGNCPYPSTSSTKKTTTKHHKSSTSKYSNTEIKKVQKALNKCKYDCGKADGIIGDKTKKAISKYQKDNNLTETGSINKTLLKSLGIK